MILVMIDHHCLRLRHHINHSKCDWLPPYGLARPDRYNIQLFGYLHTELSQALHMQKASPGQGLILAYLIVD
jgi:hypothetical protein